MKDYTKPSFEKAFREAVTNFDETKIFFAHKGSRKGGESYIQFVWEGKLRKFKMYRTDYHLALWANHFIDFLNTGEFDYNGYWRLYANSRQDKDGNWVHDWVDDKIYKFSLCKKLGSDFYEHSDEMTAFYKSPEGSKIGKQHGIKLIPKPL